MFHAGLSAADLNRLGEVGGEARLAGPEDPGPTDDGHDRGLDAFPLGRISLSLRSKPAGQRHNHDDEEDDSSEAATDARPAGIESDAAEQNEKDDQNQQKAHGASPVISINDSLAPEWRMAVVLAQQGFATTPCYFKIDAAFGSVKRAFRCLTLGAGALAFGTR